MSPEDTAAEPPVIRPEGFRAETAGRLMVTDVPRARADTSIQALRKLLAGRPLGALDLVLVVDEVGALAGVVRCADTLLAEDSMSLASLMDASWPTVLSSLDQEQAADVASRSGRTPLVVVAATGEPLGFVPDVRLLGAMAHEHREDMNRIVGITRHQAGARHALDDPPLSRVGRRLPWLLVGLLLSSVGTLMMASFEAVLKSNVTLAFFIPAVVYLTDAIGTQTEAIAVRGLSLAHRPLRRVLAGEVLTGALIGLVLGVFSFVGVWLAFHSAAVALGVALTLLVAGTLASGLGLLLPWILSRLGVDPAFGSGPVATIVQDVLTLLVYFLTMMVLVPAP